MPVNCSVCDKVFKQKFTLNRHNRLVHKIYNDNKSRNTKCLEDNCNSSFVNRRQLCEHLKEAHNFAIETEEVRFKTVVDYETWKSNVQQNENCSYIKEQGKKAKGDGTSAIEKQYYVCNRSSRHGKKESGGRKRASKSQGSCKLSHNCISSMSVTISTKEVLVYRIKTHYGHEIQLQHLRLSEQDRALVAKKLIMGTSAEKILDSNRNNIGSELKRIDLLTRQDVVNIKRAYKLQTQDVVLEELDNVTSIETWIKQCEDRPEENPVLLYKKEREPLNGFEDHDFCLVIMDKYQEYLLGIFGSNIICVDSTHYSNNHDFQLTTIIIVDEYGEGFPVSFMFTNRTDASVLETFFSLIKEKVGPVYCQTFMSDVTSEIYEAWCNVMGDVENQLFCSWHVDRAWKSQFSKIPNKEKRSWAYETVKAFQQNLDYESENDFQTQLISALVLILQDDNTKDFGVYFEKNFINNYRQWADFFRKDSGINNMFLESMHKIVKCFSFINKTDRSLDMTLQAVVKYTRDKMAEKAIKSTKGKRTKFVRDILKHHRAAVESSLVVEKDDVEETKWIVRSDNDCYYLNKKLEANCCNTRCPSCDICLHMYSCTCEDFLHKSCICQHIHLVALASNNASSEVESTEVKREPSQGDNLCLNFWYKKPTSSSGKKNKDKIASTIESLQLLNDSIDYESIDNNLASQVCTLLKKAHDLLKTQESSSNFVVAESSEPQENSEPQKETDQYVLLYSTKPKKDQYVSLSMSTAKNTNMRQPLKSGSYNRKDESEIYITPCIEDHNYF